MRQERELPISITPVRVATHEAGHAVVAHRLGLPIERILLQAEAGWGFTKLGLLTGLEFTEPVDWLLCNFKLGGPAAEYRRHRNRIRDLASPHDDYSFVERKLAEMYPDQNEREVARLGLERSADKIVRENWRTVLAVAEALLKSHTLDRDQFIAIPGVAYLIAPKQYVSRSR